MSRDNAQKGTARARTTGKEAARQAAWERQESARRERAVSAHHPKSATSRLATHCPKGTRGPVGRRCTDDTKGIQGMAGIPEGTVADALSGLEGGFAESEREHAQAASRGSTSRAGNGRSASATEADAAEAIRDAARAANAAREQPLYAAPRGYQSAESVDEDSQSVSRHTAEHTEILAKMLASMFIVASDMPAKARDNMWPVGEDGKSAGDFWRIRPDEGLELGRAWAAVIAIYAPPDMIGGASVLLAAIATTSISVGSRVIEDAQRSRMVAQLKAEMEARSTAAAQQAA